MCKGGFGYKNGSNPYGARVLIVCTKKQLVIIDELWKGEPVRQLGVRVSELTQNDFHQLALFEKDYIKQRVIDRAVDSLREKFGNSSVFRSSFLNSGVRFSSGGTVDDEEYPMMSSQL